MRQKERYAEVVRRFEREMPSPQTELHYGDPFQLLVAVILSAQCTDKRINQVTPALFAAYPDAAAMAAASQEQIYEYIKSVSYPNNKTKALMGMSRKLVADFGGQVPDTLEDLMSLPGVGRKTANVVLAVIYNRPTMAVDTHVFRVAERIGLTTRSRTPLKTELKLTTHLPEEVITRAHHWLILHGRYTCKARNPQCEKCFLADICRARQRELARLARLAPENHLPAPAKIKTDKTIKTVKTDKTDKFDKTVKTDKTDKIDKTVKTDKTVNIDKLLKSDKSELTNL